MQFVLELLMTMYEGVRKYLVNQLSYFLLTIHCCCDVSVLLWRLRLVCLMLIIEMLGILQWSWFRYINKCQQTKQLLASFRSNFSPPGLKVCDLILQELLLFWRYVSLLKCCEHSSSEQSLFSLEKHLSVCQVQCWAEEAKKIRFLLKAAWSQVCRVEVNISHRGSNLISICFL